MDEMECLLEQQKLRWGVRFVCLCVKREDPGGGVWREDGGNSVGMELMGGRDTVCWYLGLLPSTACRHQGKLNTYH